MHENVTMKSLPSFLHTMIVMQLGYAYMPMGCRHRSWSRTARLVASLFCLFFNSNLTQANLKLKSRFQVSLSTPRQSESSSRLSTTSQHRQNMHYVYIYISFKNVINHSAAFFARLQHKYINKI